VRPGRGWAIVRNLIHVSSGRAPLQRGIAPVSTGACHFPHILATKAMKHHAGVVVASADVVLPDVARATVTPKPAALSEWTAPQQPSSDPGC